MQRTMPLWWLDKYTSYELLSNATPTEFVRNRHVRDVSSSLKLLARHIPPRSLRYQKGLFLLIVQRQTDVNQACHSALLVHCCKQRSTAAVWRGTCGVSSANT